MTSDTATSAALTVEIISTILSLLILPVNIIFVYVIFKERNRAPYGSSFFRLCIHLSVADICMAIFITLFFKLPMFGLFPQSLYNENWSVVPIFGFTYLGHAQAIGIIFIAVNRFTAVYYPIRHKQNWWRPTVTTILLVLQWTIPILFVIPLFFTSFHFTSDPTWGTVMSTAVDEHFHKIYFLALAILDGVVINIIVSALYIAIFIRVALWVKTSIRVEVKRTNVVRDSRVQTHVVVRKPGELAMRLALSAFIIFICYLCLGIFSVLSSVAAPEDAWMFRTIWFVVNDVLCASNAPILLAINRPIRKLFLRNIGINIKSLGNKSSLLNHV